MVKSKSPAYAKASQSNSKSQSNSSRVRRNQKESSGSKKSRGRPTKEETSLLLLFGRHGDKSLKAEVLWNCIIRRMIRKINTRFEGKDLTDKKLKDINPLILAVDEIIDAYQAEIQQTLHQWIEGLRRTGTTKNRQYNQKEIRDLLSNSPIILEIYTRFVNGVLSGDAKLKCKVLNLANWPEAGDEIMESILFAKEIIEKVQEQDIAERLGNMEMEDSNMVIEQDEFEGDKQFPELTPSTTDSIWNKDYSDIDCYFVEENEGKVEYMGQQTIITSNLPDILDFDQASKVDL